jgi:hypothetical protein
VTTGPDAAPRVAILADDLIWATRLADSVRRAGGAPVPVRSAGGLPAALDGASGCIVDLTALAYDGIAALSVASGAGVPVIAVGQHDDVELRRAAKAAGASHVHAYRALFEHGDRDLGAWIAGLTRSIGPDGATEETP